MSIKERLMPIVPWLPFLMVILSGVLIWLSGVFLSIIMFCLAIAIIMFAYGLYDILENYYQTETNPTEPDNSASAEEIKTLSFILLVIWNNTS
jgi:ABC-type bacteriocin/lantibiotic exporter with double-glycine peptidase domain